MLKLEIKSKDVLIKNYREEFKYGAFNLELKEQNLSIGDKVEVVVILSFENNEEYSTKARVSIIDTKGIVLAFENNETSIKLHEKIKSIVSDEKLQSIF